ncbi:MAG: GntR family transcriptional regulator [Lachnospiraceae bacterium]|nr:MAG: GntR family transcriptional regulator [Lachnospiraceae bacterium]
MEKGNLNDVAYQKMLEMLINGHFQPDTIYSERQISARIGVSRTPFHTALVRLEREGYVDILPSRGFQLHHITEKEMRGIYDMRCAIEFYCCSILMQDYHAKASSAVDMIKAMEKNLGSQEEIYRTSGNIPDFNNFDYEFHACPIRYIDQRDFTDIFKRYTFWILNLSARSLKTSGRMPIALKEHRAVLEAIKENDLTALYNAERDHFNNAFQINKAFA